MFRPWADWLPPEIELRAIKLPGRHARHPRPAFADFDTAGAELAEALGPELEPPYALFGHSMGALIAYRMIRALGPRGFAPPSLYVVASCLVHGIPVDRLPDPDQSDERFIDTLRQLGGMTPEALADPEVLAFTLPVLRADFRLCRSYIYRTGESPLRVPLRVFGGATDTVTPLEQLATWREHTRHFLGMRSFPGDHFFLRDEVGGVVGAVVDDITALSRQSAISGSP